MRRPFGWARKRPLETPKAKLPLAGQFKSIRRGSTTFWLLSSAFNTRFLPCIRPSTLPADDFTNMRAWGRRSSAPAVKCRSSRCGGGPLQTPGPTRAGARLDATPAEADHFGHGRVFVRHEGEPGEELAVFEPGGRFLGVARRAEGGRVLALRLMATGTANAPVFT